ncbi:MAG: hypothetical protein AAF570_12420 [Bacteroidota bacterium]
MKSYFAIFLTLLFALTFSATPALAQDAEKATETEVAADDCNCPEFWDYQYRSLDEALADKENTTSLDISMQKLSEIDARIGELSQLQALDLSFNRFSKFPESFKNLENLTCLKLTGCQFLSSVPEIIQELPNLKCLDIGDHPKWSKDKFEKAKAMLPGVKVTW